MKIVHLGKYYPPRWGGMETAVQDMCEMSARWAEVEAVVAHEGKRTLREYSGGVRVTRLATAGVLHSQPLTWGLPGYLRGLHADLLHIHEPNPLAVASWLATRRLSSEGPPAVIHYHSDIVRQKTVMRLYRHLQQRAFAGAAAIVAGSTEVADSKELARWRHKVEVIPFGIRLDPYLALERAAEPGGTPLVLAVGRLSYYKGFEYLIDAVRGLPVRLVIAGEGELRNRLEIRIAEQGAGKQVYLAGRVSQSQLLHYYRDADIFCLPSCENSEAFGLVQLEAMGAGLPVISTNLPTGMRAINRDGETGIVVPPHSADALRSAVETLCSDFELRRRMGAAGRERARTYFSRELMGKRIEALYSKVLGKKCAGGTAPVYPGSRTLPLEAS